MLCARVWERVSRSSCTRVSTSVWSPPPGLHTPEYVCTVRTHKGFIQCAGCSPPSFVLLCTSVRCEPKRALCGANAQGRYTVCWYSPIRALYPVLMCSCGSVRSEPARALCFCVWCEPQGLYTVCWCSPPRALHPVLMCSCGRLSR